MWVQNEASGRRSTDGGHSGSQVLRDTGKCEQNHANSTTLPFQFGTCFPLVCCEKDGDGYSADWRASLPQDLTDMNEWSSAWIPLARGLIASEMPQSAVKTINRNYQPVVGGNFSPATRWLLSSTFVLSTYQLNRNKVTLTQSTTYPRQKTPWDSKLHCTTWLWKKSAFQQQGSFWCMYISSHFATFTNVTNKKHDQPSLWQKKSRFTFVHFFSLHFMSVATIWFREHLYKTQPGRKRSPPGTAFFQTAQVS